MNRRVSMAAGLAVSLLAGTARADLTVYYATDTSRAPLVATVAPRAPERSTPEVPALPERPAPREILFVRVGDGPVDEERITLLDAEGAPDAAAIDRLSILARPRGMPLPRAGARASRDPELVAPGIRRLHPQLLARLARLGDRFPDRGIEIVSGYRPDASEGSRHRHARALDLRVRGESIDEVRAFLDALPETGVGFYPVGGFVHVDVRSRSVHWVDRSGPGEAAAIVREGTAARRDAPVPAVVRSTVEDARLAIEGIDIDLDLDLSSLEECASCTTRTGVRAARTDGSVVRGAPMIDLSGS